MGLKKRLSFFLWIDQSHGRIQRDTEGPHRGDSHKGLDLMRKKADFTHEKQRKRSVLVGKVRSLLQRREKAAGQWQIITGTRGKASRERRDSSSSGHGAPEVTHGSGPSK
ncbi:hypothetical protein WMY93_028899 [Mugilogobius chulae]|uniref:Uncharacterized protein n=1 Tax=Mugilogobius chulae TaxID=88201 RepID=A0AAW0MQQ6_9GOBI